jgi:hypothetical protein
MRRHRHAWEKRLRPGLIEAGEWKHHCLNSKLSVSMLYEISVSTLVRRTNSTNVGGRLQLCDFRKMLGAVLAQLDA